MSVDDGLTKNSVTILCGVFKSTETPTPTQSPTPSPTPASSPTPVVVVTPTPEITLTPTPAPSPIPSPSPTPVTEPSPQPSPIPTPEPSPEPTVMASPTYEPTPQITPTPAPSPTEPPTAVELVYFTVKVDDDGKVMLKWRTATEVDNAGFNICCSKRKNSSYKQINSAIIPAKGNSTSGARYSYEDTPVSGDFYYKLEDVDSNGASAMHGPVKVRMK